MGWGSIEIKECGSTIPIEIRIPEPPLSLGDIADRCGDHNVISILLLDSLIIAEAGCRANALLRCDRIQHDHRATRF
jgi:hypothetical protein